MNHENHYENNLYNQEIFNKIQQQHASTDMLKQICSIIKLM